MKNIDVLEHISKYCEQIEETKNRLGGNLQILKMTETIKIRYAESDPNWKVIRTSVKRF